MIHSDALVQEPAPGKSSTCFSGDVLTFALTLPAGMRGSAWLRTNIGHAERARAEIIRSVHFQETPLGRDWFDIPMQRVAQDRFEVRLGLCEVGHFEAKCFFLREGESSPVWPPGANTSVNVDSAESCCANIIYNAFVRQFGPNKSRPVELPAPGEACVRLLDAARFTVIPPSGTFRDLIGELDFILGELGCRILMLLPIHPTPTTYGRMGRFGSPYAALSFRSVDPALAVFDPKATPTEQFIELADAVHRRNGRVFLDIAINHTGWAANLHTNHPEWLARTPEGRIEVPGAWGVQWEDLTKLDYRHEDLWRFMAEVFLTWCRRGVDGFRCDAGYMVPHPAWRYIVARVREQFPDTTFLLEGLGGKISVTRQLLNTANLNWAYSELFQNYDRSQIENYLPEAFAISAAEGLAVHFAETHDNPRLAATSHTWARMRTALSALASVSGAFGFANGVEWLAPQKINVHEAVTLNWGAPVNQVSEIRRLARLLKFHPAFHDRTNLSLIQRGDGNQLVLLRHHGPTQKRLLVLVNLDPERSTRAEWSPDAAGLRQQTYTDLLTARPVGVHASGGMFTCPLAAGQVLCLSPDPTDLELLDTSPAQSTAVPPRIAEQRLRAKALQVVAFVRGTADVSDFDLTRAAGELRADPAAFCAGLSPKIPKNRLVTWQHPRDLRREVMLPPGHLLQVNAADGFRARLTDGERTFAVEEGLPADDGSHFGLFLPLPDADRPKRLTLDLSIHEEGGTRHVEAPLLLLPSPEKARVKRVFTRSELLRRPLLVLGTNGRGAMLRAAVSWGGLESKYDALLAANISREFPEDRWVLLTRCRAWLVYQGFSQDINLDSLQAFAAGDAGAAFWRYEIPSGQGEHVRLSIGLEMRRGENAVQVAFYRHPAGADAARLADATPVRLVLRPDLESRSFHETSKAFTGPEHHFRNSIQETPGGFRFAPDERHQLEMWLSDGRFTREPEWQYMVHLGRDAERGQDPHSDLFSPGYFEAVLLGNQTVILQAAAGPFAPHGGRLREYPVPGRSPLESEASAGLKPIDVLRQALDDYLAARDGQKTVIAGYPWFLDWGRDSMIFARGLVAAGRLDDARSVLTLFGQYEERGTLPNMIRGSDTGNRSTSDAPLWFAVACRELAAAGGGEGFLKADCGGRTVKKVLGSIVRSYAAGTPNGVAMDPDSGLIYSPSHFTWMDTNFPAATPRQGYPIEIQALWHAALRFMSRIDRREGRRWAALADRVRESVVQLFWRADPGCLSDCLHAEPGQPARSATADDHLRPNQLFAITLGAVDSPGHVRKILAACEELLIPGAIRSLADRPVTHPLPVRFKEAQLNDPHRPYQGQYCGDEDTRRKPAYHNGTAWTWPFPSYCEAWSMAYGESGRRTALAWLASSIPLLETGCIGHLPEILDGDTPHAHRGCDAQAWGASEWVRVWLKLTGPHCG
ncbi:MAG: amylo-alpha-1,6-glucosidase [Desulfobacterales bacterium]